MKKTLLLALALTSISLAGCTDEGDTTVAPVVETDAVTPPVMMDDSTMMDNGAMMPDTMGAGMMDDGTMMADTTAMAPTM